MNRSSLARKSLGSHLGLLTGLALVLAFGLILMAGLLGTVFPAAGLLPELAPGNGFKQLFADPRFVSSVLLTLKTGLLATALVLLLTLLGLVCTYGTRLWRGFSLLLPPLLAVPHAAIAVGLVFLIAPSGAFVRLISPALSGWQRPPIDWVVPDAGGWALILGLVLKETPFLLLAVAAQLPSIKVDAAIQIGRTLGYSPARCWSRLVLPQLYPRIRLTLMIILAFNLSVVDMAVLLGPGNPPTFSVLLLSLVTDPDSRSAASAGALMLSLGVAVIFVILRFSECLISLVAQSRQGSGARGSALPLLRVGGKFTMLFVYFFGLASIFVLLLWSLTERWRFPNALPTSWTTRHWLQRGDLLSEPLMTTCLFALFTTIAALVTAIVWLECERKFRLPRLDWLWYLPLLVPQVTLMFGWQAGALLAGIDGQWLTVAVGHWVYALPYAVLLLATAWREFDPNWDHAAGVLGAGYWKILFRIRVPLLIRPLCQAAAVAAAVSVAQYLPTLLLGGGRFQTLAIELVTSFGGVDRRIIATIAALQSLLPLIAFIAALWLPKLWSHSSGSIRTEITTEKSPVRS